jgi:hypothetical protein
LRAGGAGSWPSGEECSAFIQRRQGAGTLNSRSMLSWASSNRTLLTYLDGADGGSDVHSSWQAMTPGCRVVPLGCWCFHVSGSMVKAVNPRGHARCAPKDRILDCSSPRMAVKAQRNCSCFAQAPAPSPPCLFGDMRPAKILAIITACRAAGVTRAPSDLHPFPFASLRAACLLTERSPVLATRIRAQTSSSRVAMAGFPRTSTRSTGSRLPRSSCCL